MNITLSEVSALFSIAFTAYAIFIFTKLLIKLHHEKKHEDMHKGADEQAVRLANLVQRGKLEGHIAALYALGLPYAWEPIRDSLDRIENKKLKTEVGKLFENGEKDK